MGQLEVGITFAICSVACTSCSLGSRQITDGRESKALEPKVYLVLKWKVGTGFYLAFQIHPQTNSEAGVEEFRGLSISVHLIVMRKCKICIPEVEIGWWDLKGSPSFV